jgi:ribonuclease VapC
MFVDASAILAILKQEEGWTVLASRLEEADDVLVSPLVVWEAVVGLVKEAQIPFEAAEQLVERFVQEVDAHTIPITLEIGQAALAASRAYGRNRHKAALNFGDCFSYACAKLARKPLLYKGNDFAQTDLA